MPADNDRGSVLIEAVELVKVEPVMMPTPRSTPFPELIEIPGGAFTIGTKNGRPDERPAHPVTLSPFAISK